MKNKLIRLRNSWNFTTKSGSERDIPFNLQAVNIIQRQDFQKISFYKGEDESIMLTM